VGEAARLLGVSPRQVHRWKAARRAGGEEALLHGNRGRTPVNATLPERRARIERVCREELFDHNFDHMADVLAADPDLAVSAETLRRWLRPEGLGSPPRRAGPHRKRRRRKEQAGAMLFLDGSPHPWFGPDHDFCCLLLCSDDATGDPLSGLFTAHENRDDVFRVCHAVFRRHELPGAFYLDRAGWSKVSRHRPDGASQADPLLTNFQLAMRELGVAVIHAHSPQARGRGERLNGSFQRRLVAELRRKGITDPAAATRYLNNSFIPAWCKRFHRDPTDSVAAWRPLPDDPPLERILAVRAPRVVGNDNCVRFDGRVLQLLPTPAHDHFVRAKVEVRRDFRGTHHVLHPRFGLLPCRPLDPPAPSPLPSPSAAGG
jgi:transposase